MTRTMIGAGLVQSYGAPVGVLATAVDVSVIMQRQPQQSFQFIIGPLILFIVQVLDIAALPPRQGWGCGHVPVITQRRLSAFQNFSTCPSLCNDRCQGVGKTGLSRGKFVPRAVFPTIADRSTMAVACIVLVLMVFSHLALCSRRLPAGAVVAHATDRGENREGDSRCGADRGVLPQIKVIVEVFSFRGVEQIVASRHRSLKSWR